MDQLDRDTLEILAAEHVLGLNGPAARQSVSEMAAGNDDLAEAIAAWETRLSPLAEALPPVTPPASLWNSIAASAFGQQKKPKLADLPLEEQVHRWQRRASRWKTLFFTGFVLGGSAAAALAALFIVTPNWATLHPPRQVVDNLSARLGVSLPAEVPPRPAAALLVDYSREPVFSAHLAENRLTLASLRKADLPEGKSFQLWYWNDARVMVWLGEVTAEGGVISLPEAAVRPGTKLCISLEDKGFDGRNMTVAPGPQSYIGRLIKGADL
jgi:anti-sigma-K factor RskA